MTAPALVALAHGSRDPRSAEDHPGPRRGGPRDAPRPPHRDGLPRALQAHVRLRRGQLVKAGYDEIVVVPLLLTEAYHAKVDVPARSPRPPPGTTACEIRATAVLGLETASSRSSTAGCARPSRRPGSASSTPSCSPRPARRTSSPTRPSPGWPGCGAPSTGCRQWRPTPRPLPRRPVRRCASSAPRDAATSRSGSLFLAPGTLPDRAAELALEAGAVAVSAPLGADPEVARTILARYAVGAVELVPV